MQWMRSQPFGVATIIKSLVMNRSAVLKQAIMAGEKDLVEWLLDSGGAAISDEHISLAQQYHQAEIVSLLTAEQVQAVAG
jgi:hypothetical protein